MSTKYIPFVIGLFGACGDNSRDLDALHEAVATSRVTIGAMVSVAETSMPGGHAVTAELRLTTPPLYAYGTIGAATLHDVQVDTVDGRIVANVTGGAGTVGCPGSI